MSDHPRTLELNSIKERAKQNASKMPHHLAQSPGNGQDKNRVFNPFPVDCFPAEIQNAINATNAINGYPIDFSGASILAVASAAIGNTVTIQVKKEFEQVPTVYIVPVGRPGVMKSPVLSFWTKPLFEKDKELFREYKKEMEQYDLLSSLSKSELEEKGLSKPERPTLAKSIVSDFTVEALISIMVNNPRGLLVYADELAGFIKNFNRYNKGSDQEFWLSNFSNKPIISDRKGSSPIFIENPFISILGAIQPVVLEEMAKDGRGTNGFMDRFIFAYPDDLKVIEWQEGELDEQIISGYSRIIRNILDKELNIDQDRNITPKVLRYSAEAYKVLKNWQKHNADLSNQADKEELSGIYSKLELYAIRFSLILQVLYWSASEDDLICINTKAVESAIKLTEYFRVTSEKVYNTIYNGSPIDNLTTIQKDLYNSLPQEFKTSTGIEIAGFYNVAERTFKRLLDNKTLFTKTKHGVYEKNY
jgi:hypothetical protein